MNRFTDIRPTCTGGGGRAAGDKRIRCYICGFLVNSKVRDVCPFCGSDNFRGSIKKVIK